MRVALNGLLRKTVKSRMNGFKNTDRILIVGGTGFIGKHLLKRCLEETTHITCISMGGKYDNDLCAKNINFVNVNIADKSLLKIALDNKSFDYVFSLGGYIDHTLYFEGGRKLIESHFVGMLNLIDCLDRDSIKGFVQVGSGDEYGNASAPQKEDVRESPISPYSFAKAASSHFIQMLFRTEGFLGVVARLFLVYGGGQDGRRFLPQIIKACLRNEFFETTEGKQIRDFCYIDDVIEALIRIAVTPQTRGQIVNVASGAPVSIREVINKVVNIVGSGKPLFGARPYRKGENMELYADIEHIKKIINWIPTTSLEDGLKKTIAYYKDFVC